MHNRGERDEDITHQEHAGGAMHNIEGRSHRLRLGLLKTSHMSRPIMEVRPKSSPLANIPQISLPAWHIA